MQLRSRRRPGRHCWYCGVPLQKGELTRDHQQPLSRGGDGGSNVVVCCRPCNNEKGNMTLEEYRRYKGVKLFHGEGGIIKDGKQVGLHTLGDYM